MTPGELLARKSIYHRIKKITELEMNKLSYILNAGLVCLLLLPSVPAQAFDEGIDFQAIEPPLPTANPDKVEVLELFWYGCPHCYKFEPYLNKWLENKPAHVEFVRMPAIFRESWMPHARAYFTAEQLKITDKIHSDFFDAYHKKKRPLMTRTDVQAFFADYGVSKKDFEDAWFSFPVQSKLKRAINMTQRYQVKGTPSMVVNGKYWTSAALASSSNPTVPGNESMLKVVDELVAREYANMQKSK
jgi:thiol:disulfide interchange protein DsbA